MKIAGLFIASVSAEQPSFEQWSAKYGINSNDNTMRQKYYDNVRKIDEWNADPKETATFAVNEFSGMTFEEFAEQFLNARPLGDSDITNVGIEESNVTLHSGLEGTSKDWDVTPVKSQAPCGACWAFAVIGAIEHVHKINTGETLDLSEQQLVDCDTRSQGCSGTDSLTYPLDYLEGRGDNIYTTASYPYTGKGGMCVQGEPSGVVVSKRVAPRGGCTDGGLVHALQTSSVALTLRATARWQSYQGGIISLDREDTRCYPVVLNHAVLATGYADGFWKIKNSWGTSWGEDGFMRMQRTVSWSDGCGPFSMYATGVGAEMWSVELAGGPSPYTPRRRQPPRPTNRRRAPAPPPGPAPRPPTHPRRRHMRRHTRVQAGTGESPSGVAEGDAIEV